MEYKTRKKIIYTVAEITLTFFEAIILWCFSVKMVKFYLYLKL